MYKIYINGKEKYEVSIKEEAIRIASDALVKYASYVSVFLPNIKGGGENIFS